MSSIRLGLAKPRLQLTLRSLKIIDRWDKPIFRSEWSPAVLILSSWASVSYPDIIHSYIIHSWLSIYTVIMSNTVTDYAKRMAVSVRLPVGTYLIQNCPISLIWYQCSKSCFCPDHSQEKPQQNFSLEGWTSMILMQRYIFDNDIFNLLKWKLSKLYDNFCSAHSCSYCDVYWYVADMSFGHDWLVGFMLRGECLCTSGLWIVNWVWLLSIPSFILIHWKFIYDSVCLSNSIHLIWPSFGH